MSVTHNSVIYFAHIEGFPILYFTRIPANWTADAGWTYTSGLMMPSDREIEHIVDLTNGVEDVGEYEVMIENDEYLLPLLATHRNTLPNIASFINRIEAGVDNDRIVLATEIASAPTTNGTFYIGNQTITYTTRNGNIHTGCARGRYADLDTSLNELTWVAPIYWSLENAVEDDIPVATLYPMTIIGRRMSVFRVDESADGTTPLCSTTPAEVIWRGIIKHYNQADDGMGIVIQSDSLMALLRGEVLGRQPSVVIDGFILNGDAEVVAQSAFISTLEDNMATIHIREEWVNAYSDVIAQSGSSLAQINVPVVRNVIIKMPVGPSIVYTLQEIVDKCNLAFKEHFNSGKCLGHYKCVINDSGVIEIHQTPIIYQLWEYNAGQTRSFKPLSYDGTYGSTITLTSGQSYNVPLRANALL